MSITLISLIPILTFPSYTFPSYRYISYLLSSCPHSPHLMTFMPGICKHHTRGSDERTRPRKTPHLTPSKTALESDYICILELLYPQPLIVIHANRQGSFLVAIFVQIYFCVSYFYCSKITIITSVFNVLSGLSTLYSTP